MVIVLGLPGGCGKSMLVRAITNLMANPLLNRGYPRLTLVRGSRLTLVTGNASALGRCGNGAVVRVLRDEESQTGAHCTAIAFCGWGISGLFVSLTTGAGCASTKIVTCLKIKLIVSVDLV